LLHRTHSIDICPAFQPPARANAYCHIPQLTLPRTAITQERSQFRNCALRTGDPSGPIQPSPINVTCP